MEIDNHTQHYLSAALVAVRLEITVLDLAGKPTKEIPASSLLLGLLGNIVQLEVEGRNIQLLNLCCVPSPPYYRNPMVPPRLINF